MYRCSPAAIITGQSRSTAFWLRKEEQGAPAALPQTYSPASAVSYKASYWHSHVRRGTMPRGGAGELSRVVFAQLSSEGKCLELCCDHGTQTHQPVATAACTLGIIQDNSCPFTIPNYEAPHKNGKIFIFLLKRNATLFHSSEHSEN